MISCWGNSHVPGCDCNIKQEKLFVTSHKERLVIIEAWSDYEIPYAGVVIFEEFLDSFIVKDLNKYAYYKRNLSKEKFIGKELREAWPMLENIGFAESMREVLSIGEPIHIPETFYRDNNWTGYTEAYIYKIGEGKVMIIFRNIHEELPGAEMLYNGTDTERIPRI